MNSLRRDGAQSSEESDEQERELSPHERAEVRDMLERDKRARWLWASLRTWAIWIAAVTGGITIGWEAVVKTIRAAKD